MITPKGVIHLEKLLKQALRESYELNMDQVKAVTNEMFSCSSGHKRYFVRVTNYKTIVEQQAEVDWTVWLHDKGLVAPEVLFSKRDRSIESITYKDKEIRMVVYRAAPGEHVKKGME